MAFILDAIKNTFSDAAEELSGSKHSHTHVGEQCAQGLHRPHHSEYRYGSFAPQSAGDVKWFVDGCGYMWAVSKALEQARESIWILDWWLSPELYLRRPPSRNEQYRLDRMLQVAAERGVKVNIIVYKEVTQALTLSSSHTKHALEDLHPNICVFRHPDHLPDAQTLESSFVSSLQHLSLSAATVSKLPGDTLKAVYGMNEDVILYWAHHEKLCLIDGKIAFMGGLDLCYGRWDTNQHSIADAHPGDLNDIVFPGQDFNNARIMDFSDVAHWEQNKLDRKESSRMGWSDISICVRGSVVQDLREHFVQRWNFIYNEKYDVRGDTRYSRLSMTATIPDMSNQGFEAPSYGGANQSRRQDPNRSGDDENFPEHHHHRFHEMGERLQEQFEEGIQHVQSRYLDSGPSGREGGMPCQLVRSCTKWSHGIPTEHSIATAYISVIENSQHFLYIENQFFITATSDSQKPVRNKLGAALVERILRAARDGEKYKVIVVMPSIPAFSGDLKDDSSLGTRAIMEYQYNSINRGGHSIMEEISKAGFDPTEYIRFYNLRNYDRINASADMRDVEEEGGVDYETARREHDDQVDPAGYRAQGGAGDYEESSDGENYRQYQQAAKNVAERKGSRSQNWDSVSKCYMLGGPDIRDLPWEDGDLSEMDSFVSEELYVHSKVLIADDRTVICGSANLNDRSQLGEHDSEIALVIEDPTFVNSYMNGQPWQASKFAATLRRQLTRKHLGLVPAQDMERPNQNFEPIGVPNLYDFGSAEDEAVMDPLSEDFLNFWNSRAKQNTAVFSKIFHPVPDDSVRTWKDYDKFYETFFHEADEEADGKSGNKTPAKYRWGHVVAEEFSEGAEGTREVKNLLSTIKGTLVEMPLLFLIEEDIAKQGLSLNAFTEDIYT